MFWEDRGTRVSLTLICASLLLAACGKPSGDAASASGGVVSAISARLGISTTTDGGFIPPTPTSSGTGDGGFVSTPTSTPTPTLTPSPSENTPAPTPAPSANPTVVSGSDSTTSTSGGVPIGSVSPSPTASAGSTSGGTVIGSSTSGTTGDGGFIPPTTAPSSGDGGTIASNSSTTSGGSAATSGTSTTSGDTTPVTAGCGFLPCPPTVAPTVNPTSQPTSSTGSTSSSSSTTSGGDGGNIPPAGTTSTNGDGGTIASSSTTSSGDGGAIASNSTTSGGTVGTTGTTSNGSTTGGTSSSSTTTTSSGDGGTIASSGTTSGGDGGTIASTGGSTSSGNSSGGASSSSGGVCPGGAQAVTSTVLLLDPAASASLDVTGNGALEIAGALVIDSNAAQAARATGNAEVHADRLDIVGLYDSVGNAVFRFTSVAQLAAPVADPLRFLPEPDLSAMPVRSSSTLHLSQGATVLLPGRYIGGISIDGKASVSLVDGVYAIDGGMLQVAGQAKLQGDGAMIYLKPGAGSQGLHFAGQSVISLKPPSSGAYRGISIFQTRASSAGLDLTGQQSWNLQGMIYAAGAPVMLAGNGVLVMGAQYISRTMAVHGNGTYAISGPGATPPIGCGN